MIKIYTISDEKMDKIKDIVAINLHYLFDSKEKIEIDSEKHLIYPNSLYNRVYKEIHYLYTNDFFSEVFETPEVEYFYNLADEYIENTRKAIKFNTF